MLAAATEFEHADVDAAVVFVDLAGFTAYTETHGDHRAAQLSETFALVSARVLGSADEMIKTIGDAVLVMCQNATSAVGFLRRLTTETGRIPGFPMLRAGVAAGPVVKRRGDVFGSTVNTAARLVAIAQAGQIVVNDAAASTLQAADLAALTALGPLELRNVGTPVEAFTLDVATRHRHHVDPICRMHVPANFSGPTITRLGTTYRFCSTDCLRQFSDNLGSSTSPRREESMGPSVR